MRVVASSIETYRAQQGRYPEPPSLGSMKDAWSNPLRYECWSATGAGPCDSYALGSGGKGGEFERPSLAQYPGTERTDRFSSDIVLANGKFVRFPKERRGGFIVSYVLLGVVALGVVWWLVTTFLRNRDSADPIRPSMKTLEAGITVHDTNGITVLQVTRRIDFGWEALQHGVTEALGAGKKRIIIDLSNVSRILALGVGTLFHATEKARAAGAEIKISNLSKEVREVLEITGVLPTLDVYSDEAEAVASSWKSTN